MRRLLSISALLALPLAGTALWACSSDDTTSTPQADGGSTGNDGGTTTTDSGKTQDSGSAPKDAGPAPVRCTQAEFDQAASTPVGGDYTSLPGADISFPTSAVPAQYTPRCVKVKQHSTVTFTGAFNFHPLQPSGGDTPSPIPSQSTNPDGGTLSIMMTDTGTFGFECGFHPTSMFGAIQVVP